MKRWGLTAALYLLLTFASGAAVGGFGLWLYQSRSVRADTPKSRSEEYRKRYLQEMETRLKLSGDQKQKLVTILDNTRQLFRELGEKHRPEYNAIHQNQVEQINAILEGEQKAEYEKLRQERDKRRKSGPPPPF